jgi:hypothetical protein
MPLPVIVFFVANTTRQDAMAPGNPLQRFPREQEDARMADSERVATLKTERQSVL